jgi:hypothetical protein
MSAVWAHIDTFPVLPFLMKSNDPFMIPFAVAAWSLSLFDPGDFVRLEQKDFARSQTENLRSGTWKLFENTESRVGEVCKHAENDRSI